MQTLQDARKRSHTLSLCLVDVWFWLVADQQSSRNSRILLALPRGLEPLFSP